MELEKCSDQEKARTTDFGQNWEECNERRKNDLILSIFLSFLIKS
tara:strand:- start:938 stop:1072 length:135 start_codon:yes stop_codon:yes gene_type:complete